MNNSEYNKIISQLNEKRNLKKAKDLSRYFKAKKGEYGEGDIFLGLTSQQIKDVAKMHYSANLAVLQKLLDSKTHEKRVCALRILVKQFTRAKEDVQRQIFEFYIKNTKNINNWDLVDLSAPYISGHYLLNKNRKILYDLVQSRNIWSRRISIMSTFAFIRNNDFYDALKISEILLEDKHDLIHKAVGWMLREVGNRDRKKEEEFLNKHVKKMPRTMLRYAIEKFPKNRRLLYLNK